MASLTDIADQKERDMVRAFLNSIKDIKDSSVIRNIEEAIERQDFDALFRMLGLEPESFSGLAEEIRAAYQAGGINGVQQIGAVPDPSGIGQIQFRFNMTADAAVSWVLTNSSELISEINTDQKEMVRQVVSEGLSNGDNPRTTALDLVGRIDRQTGSRKGGYIGLTSAQQKWVSNAKSELQDLNSNYFNRGLRDKRFDSLIQKSINTGEPLTQTQINRIIGSLQNRTLRYRANMIGRTESINALRAGQRQSIEQAIERAELDVEDVTREWDATGDQRTRLDHLFMEGQKRGFDEPFDFPDGSQAMFPGDDSLGAPANQLIQCRCRENTKIDFIGRAARVQGFR